MHSGFKKRSLLVSLFLFCKLFAPYALAQTDLLINGLWYNEERTSKIRIYKASDGKYYGKIVWLKVSEEGGKPRTDRYNFNKYKRNDSLLGLVILTGFTKETEKLYDDGSIYDPKNGKTYSCKINYADGRLSVCGYIGFSLVGRTTIWTKAE